MMFALHGKPSDVDAFQFFLAEKLCKTICELQDMPASEYVQWAAYYKAKTAVEGVRGGGR